MPLPSPPLRRPPIVEFEVTSQPFLTLDGTVHVELAAWLLNQLVVETLVIALKVVVLRILLHGHPKVTLAQWNNLGQTFGLDRADESLRVGVQVRAAGWKFERLDAGGVRELS